VAHSHCPRRQFAHRPDCVRRCLAALAGYLGYNNAAALAFIAYGVSMGMVGLGTILYLLLREPTGHESEANVGRRVVLVSGGLAGLFTFLLGLVLLYVWWDSVFSGGLEKWRANVPSVLAPWRCSAAWSSCSHRCRSPARRCGLTRCCVLLYGYNAALTWILLFCVLGFLNLLAYMPVQRAPCWGRSRPSSIRPSTGRNTASTRSPESVRSLRSLNKPVKIYAIISNGSEYRRDVDILLNNFRGLTDRLTVEYLSPDLDADRVKELAKEYKATSREGFLVLVGTKPNEEHAYIELDNIINTQGGFGGDRKREIFQGEYHLIKHINFIVRENKVKPTLYFTQGHGEPGVNDSRPSAVKLNTLKTILDDNNFEVKERRSALTPRRCPTMRRSSSLSGRRCASRTPR
jgi:hypothetical protein